MELPMKRIAICAVIVLTALWPTHAKSQVVGSI